MILMAIDHVRVYSGLPAGGDTAGIFFTRWVTHFCAPGFVFFAGTAAFLHGRRLGPAGLARYLLTRGALLVALELTLIRFFWTFDVSYANGFLLAGVIWMLGWCMIALAVMVRFPPAIIGWAGVAIVALQQLFSRVPALLPEGARAAVGPLWEFVYPAGFEAPGMQVLYVLVPWVGVMMAGYGFGPIMVRDAAARDRLLVRLGVALTALFLIGAGVLAARADGARPFVFRLLDQQKYPASPLFLLMTLGPMIALLPFAGRTRDRVTGAIAIIGRVPLFYYLLHILLIHVSALVVNMIRTGATQAQFYATAPYAWMPEEQRWSLGLLYLVFALDVTVLFVACRWYAGVKARRPGSWMRYL